MVDQRRLTYLLCNQIHVRREANDDEAIAALAGRQEGIAGRTQLLSLAITARAIHHRLKVGRLRRLFPGVYAVGHEAVGFRGRSLAAVMAMAPGAAASHITAAALWGACDPLPGAIHVTAANARRQPRSGLIVHRGALPSDELDCVDGVPVTRMARALLDLSAAEGEDRLRRLVKAAEFEHLVTLAELKAILARYPRRRGRRSLAAIVGSRAARAGKTRSEFEDLFVDFCVARGLPLPDTNVALRIGGRRMEVDCLWPRERVIVELDGRQAHDNHLAFEEDRARDRALAAARWLPIRVTWAQFHGTPDALEADLRVTLTARREDGRQFGYPPGT